MPVCDVCNGSEFVCTDGKFYCVDCDTQSQNFVEEEVAEVTEGASFTTKRLKKRQEKATKDKGRPWRTVEGFQLIIKAHLKALIDLGVDPAIDGVMQQIWFKFLQKNGQAVFDREQEVGTTTIERTKFRDYFIEHSKDEVLPKFRKFKIRLSKNAAKKRADGQGLDNEQEWFSVDTDATSSEEEGATTSDSQASRTLPNYRKISGQRWNMVNSMSMMKVICFCYLALRWRKEFVTIGDLMHWVETGTLPYFGAVECFLPHMKLFQGDFNVFIGLRPLEFEQVAHMSYALKRYVEMPNLPRVDVANLTARYLLQLNLPTALAAYTHRLTKSFGSISWPDLTGRNGLLSMVRCRLPELIAVGLIAVVLKLLFVLNDQDEWQKTAGDELPCPVHGNEAQCTAFNWKSWVRQHLLQQAHTKKTAYTLLDKGTSPEEVGDVHACMEHHMSVLLKGTLLRSDESYEHQKKWVEMKSHAFKRLVEKQGSAEKKLEKEKERKSATSSYVLLGRGDGICSEDFTSACVAKLAGKTFPSGCKYIRYDYALDDDKLDDFHSSYGFLLNVLSQLTKASWLTIHDYVWAVEGLTVERYSKGG